MTPHGIQPGQPDPWCHTQTVMPSTTTQTPGDPDDGDELGEGLGEGLGEEPGVVVHDG